jgi:hypothetical protein
MAVYPMETPEKTLTPREELFSQKKYLQSLTESAVNFLQELVKISTDEELDNTDDEAIAHNEKFYNELYTVEVRDSEGEVISQQNILDLFRDKFTRLGEKIETALVESSFADLIVFLEHEQQEIRDDVLFQAAIANSDMERDLDYDVLVNWYNGFLNSTIRSLDKMYKEPELDLKQ